MSPRARAAALRGDDYQHVIGLFHAARVLTDPELASVSVEDAHGGSFDDIVVRAVPSSTRPHEYRQVKSGVYRETTINSEWLLKRKTNRSHSPLESFHQTWIDLVTRGEPFMLELVSNKNFDDRDALLKLIDLRSDQIPRARLDALGRRSNGGKQLAAWAEHLAVDVAALKDFLVEVRFVSGEAESSWADRAGSLLARAGFRGSRDAVTVATAMVRDWVKDGVGERTAEDIRTDLTALGLLSVGGEVVLAVHGIDRVAPPLAAHAQVDFVDLYVGDDAFSRRRFRDAGDWAARVLPALAEARTSLERQGSRRLHLFAHMRLAMYFAVGRTFPGVARWVITTDFGGAAWATDVEREPADLEVRPEEPVCLGGDLAVLIGLTHVPTDQVLEFIRAEGLPVHQLLTLTTPSAPNDTSVPGPGWAAAWVRQARDHVRNVADGLQSNHIHMFMAAPAGVALFLGHDWNLLPDTTVYEHLRAAAYVPTMTFPG